MPAKRGGVNEFGGNMEGAAKGVMAETLFRSERGLEAGTVRRPWLRVNASPQRRYTNMQTGETLSGSLPSIAEYCRLPFTQALERAFRSRLSHSQLAHVTPRLTRTWPLSSVTRVTANVQSSSSASKARPTLMAGPRPNGCILSRLRRASQRSLPGLVRYRGFQVPVRGAAGAAATAARRPQRR